MNKHRIKKIAGFFVFLLLICLVFLRCTYLFRNTNASGNITRENIVGFYDEKENSLDVVFIGGSNAYRYWDCMQAWNEYGFTSYNYAVSKMASGTILPSIKEIMKTQEPELLVIDVRKMLTSLMDTTFNPSVRNALDSQDYNLNRLSGVEYFRKINGISVKDALDSYIDLIHYHDNYDALSNPLNWKLRDNREENVINKDGLYKGFAIVEKHAVLEMPADSITQESKELPEISKRICIDILEYCKNEEIPVLLVASPYQLTKEDKMEINALKSIAESYDVDLIDFNEYYEEMSLDFSTDFYNKNHVNLLGAEKYTEYLGKYLVKNYHLPDHRNDADYAEWNAIYADYSVEQKAAKDKTLELINEGTTESVMEELQE